MFSLFRFYVKTLDLHFKKNVPSMSVRILRKSAAATNQSRIAFLL